MDDGLFLFLVLIIAAEILIGAADRALDVRLVEIDDAAIALGDLEGRQRSGGLILRGIVCSNAGGRINRSHGVFLSDQGRRAH